MTSTVYDVDAGKFNIALAEELKKIESFVIPEWAYFVKTAVARERPPQDENWWYNRAASILRQAYTRGVVGVNRLKSRYGGRKNRGARPAEFRKGSGKIIRLILQQSEQAGLLKKSETKRKGRELTEKGKKFMDDVADKIIAGNK
jgi:small subunit ribosomal protein S19e